jgi:hypothetical protein
MILGQTPGKLTLSASRFKEETISSAMKKNATMRPSVKF